MMKKVLLLFFIGILITSCGGGNDKNDGTNQPTNTVVANSVKTLNSNSSLVNALQANNTTSDILVFDSDGIGTETIVSGDLLVFDITDKTPYGLLRKVLSVVRQNDNIVVSTEQAKLTDIFEQASLSYNNKLDLSPVSIQQVGKNNKLKKITVQSNKGVNIFNTDAGTIKTYSKSLANKVTEFDGCTTDIIDQVYSLDLEVSSGISIFGCIGLAITPDFRIEIENFKIKEATFTLEPVVSQEIGVRSSSDLLISKETTLASINLPKFQIGVVPVAGIPVPIYVFPILEIKIGVDGRVSTSLETGGTSELSSKFGFQYDGVNWKDISDRNTNYDYIQPTVKSNAEAFVYAGPNLKLLIANIAGPELSLQGYTAITADLASAPCWTVNGGLRLGGGVQVEVMGKTIANYDKPEILNAEEELAQGYCIEIESQPVVSATVGESYEYAIIINDHAIEDLEYSISGNPTWLSLIDDKDGDVTLSGIPTQEDIAESTITITINGSNINDVVSQTYTLNVVNTPYTKLGFSGEALTIQDGAWASTDGIRHDGGSEDEGTKWSCVRDNNSGLVWEVKTISGLHSFDSYYNWSGVDAELYTANTGGFTPTDWSSLVDGSNNEALCGYTNWRVPTRQEFSSRYPSNDFLDTINVYFNSNVDYWASDPITVSPTNSRNRIVWLFDWYRGNSIDFHFGFSPNELNTEPAYSGVYPVRLVAN